MSADEPDLLPLHDEAEPSSFDRALRGYDIRQVNDYLDRVEVALGEADARHTEDGERLAAQERELVALRQRLEQAEQRAAGRPEPASLVGERLARMLALAEEEAAAIREQASGEAEALLASARAAAAREQAERTAILETREAEVEGAAAAADQLRLDAQRDAEAMREASQRQADEVLRAAQTSAERLSGQAREHADGLVGSAEASAAQLRAQADEDVRRMHDDARDEAAAHGERGAPAGRGALGPARPDRPAARAAA